MSRYIRLMMLALSEMMCTVPISIYSTYISNKGVPLQPWVSWVDTHYDFSYVGQVPAVVWRSDPNYRIAVELTRWLFPASAFLFFLLFGFGAEARKNYCATFLRVVKCLGYNSASEAPGNVIPQYVIFLHHFFSHLYPSCQVEVRLQQKHLRWIVPRICHYRPTRQTRRPIYSFRGETLHH